MALTDKICDSNARSIGQPLFEQCIQHFIRPDHRELTARFPEVEDMMPEGRFDRKIDSLKTLGKLISNTYLARLNHNDSHTLIWKLQYESKQDVLWHLELDEIDGTIKPVGVGFGTVYNASDTKIVHRPLDNEFIVSVANPMLEAVIRLHEKPDYAGYIDKFPHLEGQEFFDEAVQNLKPVGRMKSIEYLAHFYKPSHYILAWKVQYEKEDEDLLWELHLSDLNGESNLIGLGFSR